MPGHRLVRSRRGLGEGVQNIEMFRQAWAECIELQVQPEVEWICRNLLSLQEMDRYEICVYHDDACVGGLILAEDPWDAHVGPCWSVFAQYVVPDYRNRGVSAIVMREAIKIARASGAKVLAYTHRLGPWKYSTTYRRLNENPEGR